jgi:hypothetical protein
MQRFRIFATRADNSCKSSPPVALVEVSTLVPALLEAGAVQVIVQPNNAAVEYVETGAIVTGVDAAMAWRQPDDAITRLLTF